MAKGPLPKGEYAGKSSVFSTRIKPDLKARLEHAAEESGRSLSQEVEHRLRRSFVEDDKIADAFGDRRTYRMMRMMADAIHTCRGAPISDENTEWLTNIELFEAAAAAAKNVLEAARPVGTSLSEEKKAALEVFGAGVASEIWNRVLVAGGAIGLAAGSLKDHIASVARSDLGDHVVQRANVAGSFAAIRVFNENFPDLLREMLGDIGLKLPPGKIEIIGLEDGRGNLAGKIVSADVPTLSSKKIEDEDQ